METLMYRKLYAAVQQRVKTRLPERDENALVPIGMSEAIEYYIQNHMGSRVHEKATYEVHPESEVNDTYLAEGSALFVENGATLNNVVLKRGATLKVAEGAYVENMLLNPGSHVTIGSNTRIRDVNTGVDSELQVGMNGAIYMLRADDLSSSTVEDNANIEELTVTKAITIMIGNNCYIYRTTCRWSVEMGDDVCLCQVVFKPQVNRNDNVPQIADNERRPAKVGNGVVMYIVNHTSNSSIGECAVLACTSMYQCNVDIGRRFVAVPSIIVPELSLHGGRLLRGRHCDAIEIDSCYLHTGYRSYFICVKGKGRVGDDVSLVGSITLLTVQRLCVGDNMTIACTEGDYDICICLPQLVAGNRCNCLCAAKGYNHNRDVSLEALTRDTNGYNGVFMADNATIEYTCISRDTMNKRIDVGAGATAHVRS